MRKTSGPSGSSLNTLGDGFVEAINSNTLIAIANAQPGAGLGIAGQVITVPVNEANNATRVGRFGHKNQHASLISFAADAYLNEMGITSPLQPVENTSMGRSVVAFDPPELREVNGFVEDDGEDIEIFARFMRATKVPPRDTALAATSDAIAGSQLFDAIGCNVCHTRSITTSPAGTVINGGEFIVPAALGNKIIHPFSDFLLHDVGTGDGIVQNGGQSTQEQGADRAAVGHPDARPSHARRRHADLQRVDPPPRRRGDGRDQSLSQPEPGAAERDRHVPAVAVTGDQLGAVSCERAVSCELRELVKCPA